MSFSKALTSIWDDMSNFVITSRTSSKATNKFRGSFSPSTTVMNPPTKSKSAFRKAARERVWAAIYSKSVYLDYRVPSTWLCNNLSKIIRTLWRESWCNFCMGRLLVMLCTSRSRWCEWLLMKLLSSRYSPFADHWCTRCADISIH